MTHKKSNDVGETAAWLRGEGSPSVFEMASLYTRADRGIAEMKKIIQGDTPPKSWWRTLGDSLFWKLRESMYVLFLLMIRWVIFIVVYAIWCFVAAMTISYLLFG